MCFFVIIYLLFILKSLFNICILVCHLLFCIANWALIIEFFKFYIMKIINIFWMCVLVCVRASIFTFRSVIQLKFIFVHYARKKSSFNFFYKSEHRKLFLKWYIITASL